MANFLIGMCNGIIKALGLVLGVIFSVLPPSPFKLLDNSPIAKYLPGLNWLLPISEMIVIGEAWLTAIAVYYIYQIVLRWIKAVE